MKGLLKGKSKWKITPSDGINYNIDIALAKSEKLENSDMLNIINRGYPEALELLAKRNDLPENVLMELVLKGNPDVCDILSEKDGVPKNIQWKAFNKFQ
jgi:hypothetical protein